jgi:hypothetical protein
MKCLETIQIWAKLEKANEIAAFLHTASWKKIEA